MYNEASHLFYMENLFIRVNLGGIPNLALWDLHHYEGSFTLSWLPIISFGTHVLDCKRHVMELSVNSMTRSESRVDDHHFIIAGDDLPTFSRMLVGYGEKRFSLHSIELSIVIGDEVGTVGDQSGGPETPTDGNPKELLNAATKNAAASHTLANKYLGPVDESNLLISEHMEGDDSTMINKIKEAKSRWSQQGIHVDNCRVRSLLEPLRLLYDLGNLYIDAPISGQYQLAIFTSLSRARPNVHVRFAAVYTALNEAVAIHDAGDMASAILKWKGLMDTVNDFREHCKAEEVSTVLGTGQYTGLTYKVACGQMKCLVWNKLARANLSFPEDPQQVRTAWELTKQSIQQCRCNYLGCKNAEFEHDNVCTIVNMALEALDQLGKYNNVPRSHALRKVTKAMEKAMRRRPGNAMLEKELQRRLKEKQEAEMVEDASKMEIDESKVMSGHLTK